MPPRFLLTLGLVFPLALLQPVFGQKADDTDIFQVQEKVLSEQLATQPDALSLLSQRGDMRQFMGHFNEAVADFEHMIALDPRQDAPHWRLGIAYYFTGAFGKSAAQFAKYHDHDGHDRENGIWKFMAQTRAEGLDAARREMLVYPAQDREPFIVLYEMFAGKRTPEEVLKYVETKGLGTQTQVLFFAKYYVGVYTALTGNKAEGLQLVTEAVNLFSPASAGQGGPGYMWQVARLQANALKAELAAEKKP